MKWTYVIQQKLKVILLLTALIALLAFTNLIEQRNIQHMDESFNSIYYDRLIPATDIFHITENLFTRRILLENQLYRNNEGSLASLRNELQKEHQAIEARIVSFEKTFLVKSESFALSSFKDRIDKYKRLEDRVIAKMQTKETSSARRLYEQEAKGQFTSTFAKLQELSSIQTRVGLDLVKDSKSTVSSSNMVLSLQILAAITFCLIVHALIAASRMVNAKQQNFNLN